MTERVLRHDEAVNWKNWDLAILQVVFGIAGGYYIYQAVITLWRNSVDNLETPVSSIILIITGVILVGVAIVFQQISKYRERKRSITITI